MREGGRLVVVGGVAAGMSAASRARRLRPDVEIVVLEKGHDVSYASCSIPYFIAEVIPDRDTLVRYDAEFFRRERKIDVRLGAEAVALDPRAKTVTYEDLDRGGQESLEFDALVIGSGARPVKPPLPGVDLPGVFVLKRLSEGEAIKSFLDERKVERATIVGAGYVGLEMAEALRARGLEVTVVELLPRVLPNFDADMSEIVERELLDEGVILRKERRVESFEPGEGGSVGYTVAADQRVATDMVLVSVGVRPVTELAAGAGIALGPTGAIGVDARQVTSEPAVLAAGDCCEAMHVVTRKPAWIPLGTTANKQGKIAGENAVGGSAQFGGIAGTSVAKIFGLEAAQTGLTVEAAEGEGRAADSVRIKARTKSHGYPGVGDVVVKLVFETDTGNLLGGQVIGREGAGKRVDTLATALFARMTVADLAQIDMAYAPPVSPVWDPVLIAANQAVKKLNR
jgi:NADPH-dependent 2,4-dienoyl-CoA reductase/sulfur reductase-like enzyme